jgi:hypothetical protein
MAELTLNFAGVEDQKEYKPVPAGVYQLQLTDYKEGTVKSESSPNFGKTKFDFTFEIVMNAEGTTEEKHLGKKIFDNVTITENSLWRLKAVLKAFGLPIPEEGEFNVDFDELLGEELEATVKVIPARRDPNDASREFAARNAISKFTIPETDSE